MKKLKQYSLMGFLAVGLAPVFFGVRAISPVCAQTVNVDDKTIGLVRESNSPIEVVAIETKNSRHLELGRSFRDNGDWLNGFAVTFANRTKKTIVGGSIYLEFPETKQSGNLMAFPLSFGPTPKDVRSNIRTLMVKPEETFSVRLEDKELARLKRFLSERHALDSLRRAEISLGTILFDDGTAWAAGSYRVRDPSRPDVWIEASKPKEVNH